MSAAFVAVAPERAGGTSEHRPVAGRLVIGYVVRAYPRLSQTFIVNEILELERLGWSIRIYGINASRESAVQPQVARVRAPVEFLESALKQSWIRSAADHLRLALASPRRYVRTLFYVLRHAELDAGYSTESRFRSFLHAVCLAGLLDRERRSGATPPGHLHAHFAHTPALVVLLAHLLTGIPYSFTAHARDLYQIPASALAERIEHARAVVTVCDENVRYIEHAVPEKSRGKVRLIHNGIDLLDFRPGPAGPRPSPPLVASASRLVEKKGFPDLLHALARVKAQGGLFECVIYGEGPMGEELSAAIERLGLSAAVRLAGRCTQAALASVLPRVDVFALTPFVTASGDRDGIPTVLAEAMACGLPVVSTQVAGIPDLVKHEENGLLVAPRDVEAIAAAILNLLEDEEKRRRLGAAARRTVAESFERSACVRQIAAIFDGGAGDGVFGVPTRVELTRA